MNNLPREKLREIVARHGRALIEDPRRCEGLLRDYCGEYRREVSVLVMAIEERVPVDLLSAPANAPREVLFARMATRLCDHLALAEPAARWSVASWAFALGLVTKEELEVIEQGVTVKAVAATSVNSAQAPEAPAATPTVACIIV
jgi:hypothetical protein